MTKAKLRNKAELFFKLHNNQLMDRSCRGLCKFFEKCNLKYKIEHPEKYRIDIEGKPTCIKFLDDKWYKND
jgi:hypothetical protein